MRSKLLIAIAVLSCTTLWAQEQTNSEPDRTYKPLKLNLNQDGSKYVRFILWNQIWATTNNLNTPGDDGLELTEVNFSLRRSRMLAFAQISDRFLILTHFGLNNLNSANMSSLGNTNNGPQLFMHDAWGEFKVADYLFIGGGLHYWKGMTRLANQSTLNFMTLDAPRPFTHWHSLGVTDQFARHIGVYFKGDIGKLEYRLAVNNPINSDNALGAGKHYGDVNSNITYNGSNIADEDGDAVGNMIYEGYFKYALMDKESMKLPYYVGTYMGKKKMLNIGLGFFAQPNGTYDTLKLEHQNVIHFAGDVFFDHPISGGAVNAYASVQSFNYGENYMSRWAGTGISYYGQAGYYYEKWKIMPYVSYQFAQYDGLNDDPSAVNIGANYYVNGHHAKITAEYMGIYNNFIEGGGYDADGDPESFQQFRLQLHIFL
jgi:hypothetical protein